MEKTHPRQEPPLTGKINIISRKNSVLQKTLHKVRRARNGCFHDGKAPQLEVIKEILKIIEKEEPII